MKVSKLDRPTPLIREPTGDWAPIVHWGPSLLGPPDELDDAKVAGMTLHRDPVTGLLIGVMDEPEKKEKL